jgi:hypothetical protein
LNISADEKTALAEFASPSSRSRAKRKKKSSRAKSKGRRG